MNGLTPSNFKRIHLGLLLEFVLAFVMAGILVILIAIVNSRISSYDIPTEAVSWTTLEDYAGIFMLVFLSSLKQVIKTDHLAHIITVFIPV